MNSDQSTCPHCAQRQNSAEAAPRAPMLSTPAGFISCATLGAFLGEKSARHARDWCKRHGIAIRADGKSHFVLADDIDRVIAQLPISGDQERAATPPRMASSARAAQQLMNKR